MKKNIFLSILFLISPFNTNIMHSINSEYFTMPVIMATAFCLLSQSNKDLVSAALSGSLAGLTYTHFVNHKPHGERIVIAAVTLSLFTIS